MSQHRSLGEGQTLLSAGGTFELGFFKPGNSSNRYVGIWHTGYTGFSSRQIVWVANRETPINSSSNGSLTITPHGSLNVLDSNMIIWSTGTPGAVVSDTYWLQLLESGNLVLSDVGRMIWQSFDYPSHAMLPGMKIGYDFRTNREWHLTSWKSESDPSPGPYTYIIYPERPVEAYVTNGSTKIWRSGTWSGHGWVGIPSWSLDSNFDFTVRSSQDDLYIEFDMLNDSIRSMMLLGVDGALEIWLRMEQKWNLYWELPADVCATYAVCGGYGVCQDDSFPVSNCSCLKGFEPVDSVEWGLREWSHGCKRRTPLSCEKGDGFVMVGQLKLPDKTNTSWDIGKGFNECRDWCLQNCSCQAYAVTGEDGCIIWFGELIDITEFPEGGLDLYVRIASSKLVENYRKRRHAPVAIFVAVSLAVTILCSLILLTWIRCKHRWTKPAEKMTLGISTMTKLRESEKTSMSSLYPLSSIIQATNNFSSVNKLGEGGFGPVYKGKLIDGQEIAVKRLAAKSGQGLKEFENEIILIAKIQHTNLVRLLGYCIHVEEKILIYEYMPNKSLDYFLYDKTRRAQLDWSTRLHIIEGISQGLLYLHKHSRLKIIHRDLKASNILLDADMNPKISDFGLARIFSANETEANTNRIVGTYGYMSPEYAAEGLFSIKSDVFSFGVLLLEIASGSKNTSYHRDGNTLNLLGYAWELWKEEKLLELVDPSFDENCPKHEILRCIHIALMCVQEKAIDRPNMSSVIAMLSGDSAIVDPKQPAFFNVRNPAEEEIHSVNEATMTTINGR